MADSTLKVSILAVDKASKTLGAVGSKVGSLGKSLGGLGAAMGGALAVGGIVAFGTESVKAFSEAQAAQTKLSDAYARFPALAKGNIESLRTLNAEMAKKTRFDDDAFASGQAVLAQFGLNEKQLKNITPLLADYAAKTGQDLPTAAGLIGRAMMGNARALKALGINFKATGNRAKDLATIQGLLANRVGGFAAKDAQTAAGKLAILQNRFGEVKESIGATLLPILTTLMSVFADRVMPVIETGAEKFRMIARAIGFLFDGSGEEAYGFAEVMDNVFGNKGTLIPFFTQLGERIRGFAQFITGTAIPAVAAFGAWLVKYQGWLIPIVGGVLAIVAAVKVWIAVSQAFAAVQAIVNAVLAANPIGLIILAIVGLVAALVIAYKRSETFRKIVDGALRAVGGAFTWLKNAAVAAFNWIKTKGLDFLATVLRNSPIGLYIRAILAAFNWVRDKLLGKDGAIAKIRAAWDGIVSFIGGLKDRITNTARGLWDGLKNGLYGVVNWINDKLNIIIRGINKTIRGVNLLKPGSDIQEIPEIPMLAKGGIVTRPTLAMIGEAGPEAVIPLNRMNAGGGTTIVIQAGIGDPRAIAAEVKRVLSAAGARGQVRMA